MVSNARAHCSRHGRSARTPTYSFEQAWRGRPLTPPPSDSRVVVSMMVRVLMMATTSNTEKSTDLSSALCDLSDQHLGTCDWRHPLRSSRFTSSGTLLRTQNRGFRIPQRRTSARCACCVVACRNSIPVHSKNRADVNSTCCVR